MPTDADELHEIVRELFKDRRSQVLGWQMLAEAYSGLRGCEVLKWKASAKPGQSGFVAHDGKSMAVHWRTIATMPAANNNAAAIPAILIEGIGSCLSYYKCVQDFQLQHFVLALQTGVGGPVESLQRNCTRSALGAPSGGWCRRACREAYNDFVAGGMSQPPVA
jgi:hypothetical protein